MRVFLFTRSASLLVLLAAAIFASPANVWAQEAEQQFREGYFQQTHQHDYSAAAVAYEKVAGDASAPEALRAEAKTRLAQCREEQASDDLARLMPPDALAFVEINRPGKHVGRLIQMLGLSGRANADGQTPSATPLPGNLTLPGDFAISPALIRELEKGRGLAVAITGIEPDGRPHGVAVVHPGDADIPRGIIETAIQVLPQADPIGDYRVYRIENDALIAVTSRLFVVADSREQIEQTLGRMQNRDADSLAKQPEFARLAEERKDGLVFAYVNARRAVEIAAPHLRNQEAMIARTVLDLDHLESISASFGVTDRGVEAQVQVVLAEGHRNLAYNVIRTAPLSQRSLAHVPAGSAAVAVLGLNPPGQPQDRSNSEPPGVTAMDIGREVFANVEEVSAFVLAPEQDNSARIPEIGVVAAVKDPAKSEALWDQILSLAAIVEPRIAQPPQEIEIEGRKARQYQFQGAPPIVVIRLSDGAVAVGTKGAVAAAAGAQGEHSITGDPQFRPLLAAIKPESSKAVMVNVGRAVNLGAQMSSPREREEMMQIASLLANLKVMVVTHEAPNHFAIRASATGLPNVPNVVQAVARSAQMRGRPAIRAERRAGRISRPVETAPPSPPQPARAPEAVVQP
jgi:hypothetical protein